MKKALASLGQRIKDFLDSLIPRPQPQPIPIPVPVRPGDGRRRQPPRR
jgi:hypothetical protein